MRELTFNELESVSGGAWYNVIGETAQALGKAINVVGNVLHGLANANLIPDHWWGNSAENYFDAFLNWFGDIFNAIGGSMMS